MMQIKQKKGFCYGLTTYYWHKKSPERQKRNGPTLTTQEDMAHLEIETQIKSSVYKKHQEGSNESELCPL